MLTSILVCAAMATADIDTDTRVAVEIAKQRVIRARKVAPVRRVETIFRNAIGHTHTCRNGHTWDHSVTSSHNCPTCGQYQNLQDPTPRKVPIQRVIEVPAPVRVVPVQTTIRFAQPNCPNGNCPYVR